MKVAVVGARDFHGVQGGVETHCEKLYPTFVKQRCDIIVFTIKTHVAQNVQN